MLGILTCHAAAPEAGVEIAPPATRSQILLVQSVILCDDDGKNPARYALPKKLVDDVYTKADLEFFYLDPVRWNHSKARRGEINLNTIVKQGHTKGIISKDPRVVTLLFVSAVDGNKGPLGRGLQGGNICFVSLGPDGKMTDPAERAFVVAHEVGHCLGLHHVVDDPKVPNDVPNLQGDGAFAERLAPNALHPTQVKTVLASPLSLPRCYFNTAAETAKFLSHDHWDTPCENLSDNTIRFELSLEPDEKIPTDPAGRTELVRKKYSMLAVDFTEQQIATLNKLIDRLENRLAGHWPALTRTPWNFAKMHPSFCSSFPHTRGLSIVLTDEFFKLSKQDPAKAIQVLLHEKLHVVQRLLPARFETRYKQYGFERIRLPADTSSRLGLVRNPDAPDLIWAIKPEGKLMLLAATLKTINGQPQMTMALHPLQAAVDKPYTHTAGPALENNAALRKWIARFPIPNGYDDPREVIAYLLMNIYDTDFMGEELPPISAEHKALMDTDRKIFPNLLHIGPRKK